MALPSKKQISKKSKTSKALETISSIGEEIGKNSVQLKPVQKAPAKSKKGKRVFQHSSGLLVLDKITFISNVQVALSGFDYPFFIEVFVNTSYNTVNGSLVFYFSSKEEAESFINDLHQAINDL